jgi:hypothetical protein
MSISLCCNVYNDAAALRGLLETGASYFDNLFILHTGPGGAHSTDGTIELCEKFGATLKFDDIQKGYGHVRTRLIHECGCAWAFIMDADERFLPQTRVLECEGEEANYRPGDPAPNYKVTVTDKVIDQGGHLRNLMKLDHIMAVRSTRRHWLDFTMRRPTQNWLKNRDHQLRIVRNVPEIGYVTKVVMHERLVDSRTGKDPVFVPQDDMGGPFHEHFHMAFRQAYPGSKEWNEENYARLSRGEPMLTK